MESTELCPSCRRPASLCSSDHNDIVTPLTPLTLLPLLLEDRGLPSASPKSGSFDKQIGEAQSSDTPQMLPSPSLQPQSFSSLLFADERSELVEWNNPDPFEPASPVLLQLDNLQAKEGEEDIPELEPAINVRAAEINDTTIPEDSTPRLSGIDEIKIQGLFSELNLGPELPAE